MLVLASASPRRRELLTQAGFTFEVRPAHIPEDPRPGEDPIAYVVRLAREKAEAVFRQLAQQPQAAIAAQASCQGTTSVVPQTPDKEGGDLQAAEELYGEVGRGFIPGTKPFESMGALAPEGSLREHLVVLGADTTVVIDNQILGKPDDAADAARMLRLLSGRTHRVITGVAIVTDERTEVAAEVTAVKFLTLSDEEIVEYIATGEPMDKAGAYAIQGRAASWTPRIEGDYFNVVGLPLALVSTLLESVKANP
jgi:septum formation protein